MASRNEILSTRITLKAISRVAAATSQALMEFGMQTGGPNVIPFPQRRGGYDIFSSTRSVASVRTPTASAAVVRRKAVGRVDFEIPRMSEMLPLLYEEMHNQRTIGGSMTDIDTRGERYIARQQEYMANRAANFRLALLGGMLRGATYIHADGDRTYLDYTSSGAIGTIDYQIPAGNKSQLDMLGGGNLVTGSFASSGTDIPGILLNIDAAFQKLWGGRLDFAMCSSATWNYIIQNDYVVQQAGFSNPPWSVLERTAGMGTNGKPNVTFRARLSACPWMQFLVTNEGIDIGSSEDSLTYTQLVPDNYIWLGPDPQGPNGGANLMEMMEGPGAIVEKPGGEVTIRNGLHAWVFENMNPAVAELFTEDNALPALYVPNATAYATVIF